jgi:hypothetical protein
MLAAALLVLAVMVPGTAAAANDNPLSNVPEQYDPAIAAAAGELGVSADELKNASRDELQKLICTELEDVSSDELTARVQNALSEVPEEQLADLSEAERAQLEARLPGLISQLKSACETSAVDDAEDTDAEAADDEADDDAAVPERVDAGGGGLTGSSATAPLLFGGIFAALFGMFGIATVGKRRRA